MRAINHALTGAIIGLSINEPAVALPLAFASHFVLDAIPHYDNTTKFPPGSKAFTRLLIADALLCVLLVGFLFASFREEWLLASLCAFMATSPDLMWIPKYITSLRTGKDPEPTTWLTRFHHRIQWLTVPQGLWVELLWAFGSTLALITLF